MRTATKKQNTVLPQDTTAAIRNLIALTKKLSAFADHEMQALAMGDMLRFAYIQHDKEKIAEQYAASSEEFRMRVEEFRGVDKGLINELDKLQVELKKKSVSNNNLVRQIRDRSVQNTKGTLFAAQELGQRVTFPARKVEASEQAGA